MVRLLWQSPRQIRHTPLVSIALDRLESLKTKQFKVLVGHFAFSCITNDQQLKMFIIIFRSEGDE